MNPDIVTDPPHKHVNDGLEKLSAAWGEPRALNTYLKLTVWLALLAICLLIGLLYRAQAQLAHVRPLVIRIDDVGRAQAVSYDATTYQPQEYEIRHLLNDWAVKHFSRFHSTIRRDFSESLYFLNPTLSAAQMVKFNPGGELAAFMANPVAEEVEIDVTNVALPNLNQPPYQAQIDLEQITYALSARTVRTREHAIVYVDFTVFDRPAPDNIRPVNPLMLLIANYRLEQAFPQDRR
jgi:type IV secretory pathway TrbF-like protein